MSLVIFEGSREEACRPARPSARQAGRQTDRRASAHASRHARWDPDGQDGRMDEGRGDVVWSTG